MGGTVAVTIRRENGELLKMARKTGSYSWMFTSINFNNGKVNEAIDDYYKIFAEMKEDFESGEPYKFPMSTEYGWCNETMPVDYGLVFIDVMKKEIHSMQGYDNPGLISINAFSRVYVNDEETDKAYQSLLENNQLCLHVIQSDDSIKDFGMIHDVFGKDVNLKKMEQIIEDSYNDKGPLFEIIGKDSMFNLKAVPVGLKDYNKVRYSESPEGLIQFAKALQNSGLTFTTEEKKGWIEKLNDFLEDYEIDGDFDDDDTYEDALKTEKESLKKQLLDAFDECEVRNTTKNKM